MGRGEILVWEGVTTLENFDPPTTEKIEQPPWMLARQAQMR